MSIAKETEKRIKEQIEKVKGAYVLRLYDFIGARDYPSDLLVFYKRNLILLEIKTSQLKSFPFSNISDNQYTGMLCAIKKATGIKSYVLIWFYTQDTTLLCNIETIQKLKETQKSIRYDSEDVYKVKGQKKNKYYEYDIKDMLDYIIK